jgi:rare lipoprotein A
MHKKHSGWISSLILAASIIFPGPSASLQASQSYGTHESRYSETRRSIAAEPSMTADKKAKEEETVSDQPVHSSDRFMVAEGKASYYANMFHGHKTASGEHFNRKNYTAAHRSLPFGTIVRVTNLDNGRKVVVKVNDRGPYLRSRIIDISQAAAKQIGLVGHGIGHVRIEAYN